MTTHLLLVLLATIFSLAYLGRLVILRIPLAEQHYDTDPGDDYDDAEDRAFDEAASDSPPDDQSLTDCSPEELARIVSTRHAVGCYIEVHHQECEILDGECDCRPYGYRVGEKVES